MINFIVEQTKTGFSAYCETPNGIVATTGDSIIHLTENALEAYNLHLEHLNKKAVNASAISFSYDMEAFFDMFNINQTIISKRANLNNALLSQYITGNKKPSTKQKARILEAVHALGRDLQAVQFA